MDEKMFDLYHRMVEERHRIWTARQMNEPQPWTDDPVLANRKFTNMFRVLDPGSQFVFKINHEEPVTQIARLVFYRITNKPSTWEHIRYLVGDYPSASDFVHSSAILFQMLDGYRRAGNRVFSGAYIIVPEPGTKNDKMAGALRLVRYFVQEKADDFLNATTDDERFTVLRSTPGLGKFLAMQILTDWTYLQEEEPDLSFVTAGPGAIRGAALIDSTLKAEDVIYNLAVGWSISDHLRFAGRTLTPMDVQNTLCEFSKYVRERVTPRKKSVYRPAHPGPQPRPVVPLWW